MSSRISYSALLDLNLPALSPVSGAISGTTPKVSSWIKLKDVDTVDLVLTTTSTASGSWSFQVATNSLGKDAQALPNPPTTPTGTSQNSTVTVIMPADERHWLQITFTPVSGSGNANAQVSTIVGMPTAMGHFRYLGLHSYTAAADTLAGQLTLEQSGNYDGGIARGLQGMNAGKQVANLANRPADPVVWSALTDRTDTPYTIPALVASTGQNLPLRLGIWELMGIRAKFLPSAGAGSVKVHANKKA